MIEKKHSLVSAVSALALGLLAAAWCLSCNGGKGPEPDADADATEDADADTPVEPDADDGEEGEEGLDVIEEDEPDMEPPPCPMTFSDAGDMRVISFGSHLTVDDAETYESYRDYFASQAHAASDCFSADRSNLLLFPEDAGLFAGLIGSRGAMSRSRTDSMAAFVDLLSFYGIPISYVVETYGELPMGRMIFLGVTDTIWRALDMTFPAIAQRHGVYVMASANVAEVVETDDADLVARFADPDLDDVASVFVPDGPEVYNTAFLWGPDGTLLGKVHKPFITPVEEDLINLSYGPLELLRPVHVGGAAAGVLTSKDAWMPPAIDRVVLAGAAIVIQPEAFSGWTIPQIGDDDWLPDVMTQSSWNTVQKFPVARAGAMPVLTGNLFDFTFDGQAVIFTQARPEGAMGGFVGQDPRPGFLAVGPWVMPDPVEDDPALSLSERRAILRERGLAMMPGAGPPYENAYIESVVGADLDLLGSSPLPDPDPDEDPPIAGESMAIDAGEAGPCMRIRLAGSGDGVAAAWQTLGSGGRWEIRAAFSAAADPLDFGAPLGITDSDADLIAPDLAFDPAGNLLIAFQEVGGSTSVLRLSRWNPGSGLLEDLDAPLPEGSLDSWLPSLASDGDVVALAFSDRAGGHDRIYVSVSGDGGAAFPAAQAVGPAAAVEPPNTRGNQWHPDAAVSGAAVALVWLDFGAYQWDVMGAVSMDSGASWSEPLRLDDAGEGPERLHADPRIALGPDGAVLAWTYLSERRADSDARSRGWDAAAGTLEDALVLDAPDDAYPVSAWFPVPVVQGSLTRVVFQELSGNRPRIMAAGSDGSLQGVVSDTPGPAWWPEALWLESGIMVIAWLDDRNGFPAPRILSVAP